LVDLGMHRGTSAGTAALTDPDCCSFSDINLNRFSAGVVDVELDGVAVDDEAESDRTKSVPRLSANR